MGMKARLLNLTRHFRWRNRYGYLDRFDAHRIVGWAHDPQEPSQPALLSLFVDGRPEMTILADIARNDVLAAGLGPRHCGFNATPPARLRDGQPHEMVLRLGSDGPVLKRVRLRGGADAGMSALSQDPEEGVAYLDAGGAIAGWATGCTEVQIRFDNGPLQPVALDRPVSGFGSGGLQGFRLPVPLGLRDGRPHAAHVFFGRKAGDAARLLDGAPVAFTLGQGQARVEVVDLRGLELCLRLRGPQDDPAAPDATADAAPEAPPSGASLPLLHADGVALAARADAARPREITATLPGPCHLTVTAPDGTALASYDIRGSDQVVHAATRALPAEALSDAMLARAQARFDSFCTDPDDRFDPFWYRWAHPDTFALAAPAALLAHYRDTGARAGYGPGPLFDERAARNAYPAVAAAIAKGRLPCAFALELALEETHGRGALDTLQGLARPLAQDLLRHDMPASGNPPPHPADRLSPPPRPVQGALPPPTFAQPGSTAIYAAWLARLDLSEDAQTAVVQDEHDQRRKILATALTRAPLVSIIMPSWNRAFTIGEAIQSVLEQTYPNWELIICDDASEDRTADVVRGFDDRRIRYMKFLKSNGSGARNKGLAHARGDYIAYLDSDNIWHPLFLDTMLRALLADPGRPMAYSAYLDTEIRGARVHLDRIARAPFRPTALTSKNFIDLNTIVHHRALYDWMGGFDTDMPRLQDWDLVLRYTSIFRPLFVDHIGVFYRRNIAWGQVTHLFTGSNATDAVNAKTRRRLEECHERLALPWPGRGRITVLCCGPDGGAPDAATRLLAQSLTALAAPLADIDLVMLGADPSMLAPDDPALDAPAAGMGPGVDQGVLTRHDIPADLGRRPERLAAALGGLLQGRAVLALGPERGWLEALRGLDPRLVWQLHGNGAGSCLRSLCRPGMEFDLGALPLEPPPADAGDPLALVLGPARARAGLLDAAGRQRGGLLLPPDGGSGWTLALRGRIERLAPGPALSTSLPTTLPPALNRVTLAIALGPVAALSPFEQALLGAQMARGTPVAIRAPQGAVSGASASGQEAPGQEDMAQDWIAARAAFEIANPAPVWVHEKTQKLLSDSAAMSRLSTRARRVHAIAWHPDLVRERLAHALYRILHDTPEREVRDGRF